MNEKAIELLPCPFCGCDLTRGSRRINPNARCTTADCYGAKMPVVNLDVPDSVAAWNHRTALPALRAREEIARVIWESDATEWPMKAWDDAGITQATRATYFRRADAILSSAAGQEWRDISSALKDGTPIDLWADNHRWANCRWGRFDEDSIRPFGGAHWRGLNSKEQPSHWMPLPAAPVAEPPLAEKSEVKS